MSDVRVFFSKIYSFDWLGSENRQKLIAFVHIDIFSRARSIDLHDEKRHNMIYFLLSPTHFHPILVVV